MAGRTGGFEFRETMSGQWRRVAPVAEAAERPFTFTLHCVSAPLPRFLRRREMAVTGTLDAEGLATAAPLEGTLGMDLLLTRTLPYAFQFTGDDGETYTMRGQKTVRGPASLADDMTRLPAQVLDAAGEVVGEVTVYFDMRGDLVSFLRSFRLV